MVASVSPWPEVRLLYANIDSTDVITSRSSTLPYDDDTMRRMIRLVQAAKGAPVSCKEEYGC